MTRSVRARDDFYQMVLAVRTNRAKRRHWGVCFVESVVAIEAAVSAGWRVRALIHSADKPLSSWARDLAARCPGADIRPMAGELVAELSEREETSEILALVEIRPPELERPPVSAAPLYLLLDRPSSPGNLGSILRSADAFGVHGVVVRGHAADVWDPLAIRSSLGAVFTVPVATDLSNPRLEAWIAGLEARHPGLQLLGARPGAATPPEAVDFRRPTILALGNEKRGLSEWLRQRFPLSVGIRTGGTVDSLNLAAAAAVLLYEVSRQRLGAARELPHDPAAP